MMNRIEEYHLRNFIKNGVIEKIDIVENSSGAFYLEIKAAFSEEPYVMINARKSTRTWANINSIIRFLKGIEEGNVSNIPISIKPWFPQKTRKKAKSN